MDDVTVLEYSLSGGMPVDEVAVLRPTKGLPTARGPVLEGPSLWGSGWCASPEGRYVWRRYCVISQMLLQDFI